LLWAKAQAKRPSKEYEPPGQLDGSRNCNLRVFLSLGEHNPATFVLQQFRYVPDSSNLSSFKELLSGRGRSMKRATILCIDDEPTGLILRKMLLEGEGYSVLLASSGLEGLATPQSSSVEAVVLDYRMPHMSGDEVALQIRKQWPSVPIVLLSGYPQDVPEHMLNQVNAFICKGGDPCELLTAVRSVLEESNRSRTQAPERLSKQTSAA